MSSSFFTFPNVKRTLLNIADHGTFLLIRETQAFMDLLDMYNFMYIHEIIKTKYLS